MGLLPRCDSGSHNGRSLGWAGGANIFNSFLSQGPCLKGVVGMRVKAQEIAGWEQSPQGKHIMERVKANL